MIEKQAIKLMLNKKFYNQYKGSISPTIFYGDTKSENIILFKIIV